MSLDQNLMGLGLPSPLAQRIASGGTGNGSGGVAVTAKGTSVSTAYQIGGKQFMVYVNAAGASGANAWVALPSMTTGAQDMGPEIADDFVIHNGLSTNTNLTIGIPTGVTVNVGGSALTGSTTLAQYKTMQLWVVNSTQWMGITN